MSQLCGPVAKSGKQPMCGPKPGGAVWKKMITKDIRKANLEKGRKVLADKRNKEILDKNLEENLEENINS